MSQELRQRPNIFLYYITVSKSKVKSWCEEKGYISKVKQTEGEEESYISNKTLGEEAEGIGDGRRRQGRLQMNCRGESLPLLSW